MIRIVQYPRLVSPYCSHRMKGGIEGGVRIRNDTTNRIAGIRRINRPKEMVPIEGLRIFIKLFALITSAGIDSEAWIDPRGNASEVVSPSLDQFSGSPCGNEPLLHVVVEGVSMTAQADLEDIRLPSFIKAGKALCYNFTIAINTRHPLKPVPPLHPVHVVTVGAFDMGGICRGWSILGSDLIIRRL